MTDWLFLRAFRWAEAKPGYSPGSGGDSRQLRSQALGSALQPVLMHEPQCSHSQLRGLSTLCA
jgi:hypothetical protein